jgi:AcrR family transcriptional regulator
VIKNYTALVTGRTNHRQRLLEGALRCLREKGYAHTTTRDIVAASDANLGSIGYHFGSKEALLAEALAEGCRQWAESIVQRVLASEGATPLERLAIGWSATIDSLEQQRGLELAFIEALPAAARSETLRRWLADYYEEAREATRATIEAAADEAGELDETAARALASLLVAVADGLVLQWLVDPERAPSGEQLARAAAVGFPAAARPLR